MRSTTVDVGGPLHVAEWGTGPVRMVLVHGLGGAHVNWMRVAPLLAGAGRVLAPDLPGFGLSPAAGRTTTVAGYRALLDRLLRRTCDQPVVLVGNSMGGLIALAEAALHPERVAGLVLVDAVLPGRWRQRRPPRVVLSFSAYVVPPLGRRMLRRALDRRADEAVVAGAFALCAGHPERIPGEVVAAHVSLLQERGRLPSGDFAYVLAARSIVQALARPTSVRRLIDRVQVPTLMVHGGADLLVSVESARLTHRLRPDWDLRVLDEAGHIPMLEAPEWFVTVVDAWLRFHVAASAEDGAPPER